MPLFGTIVDLDSSAKAAGTAVSDVTYIQGAYKTYLTLADFQATASAAVGRFQNGQIIYVSSSNELYKVDVVFDDGLFTNVVVSQSFTFPGSGGGSTPTGSLLTTASAAGNVITFTKGDSSTFTVTVDTGSGGGGGSTPTGSLLTTSSFSGNILTFTKGDGTTFDVDGIANTTISNQFSSSQFFTGSLIPLADGSNNGIYDLGSVTNPWRDLYITTNSLNFVKDGELVSTLTGGPDYIQVGNIRISTGSLEIVNNEGDVVSTIAEAEYSGSEPVSGSILETGSLLITGSVVNNTITLTKGDGTAFDLVVATGSGGGGGSTFPFTGSAQITGSLGLTGSLGVDIVNGNGGNTKFAINNEGVAVLAALDTTPTAVTGGIYYSASQFFFGLE